MLVAAQIAVAARLVPHAGGHVGAHARAADFSDEQSAHGQRLIAHEFTGQTETRAAREQTILRIARGEFGRDLRGLLIRRAQHEHFLQRLHVPTEPHEFRREPVEQFRMRRMIRLRTKILRRLHEADAHEFFPLAVHPHARRERVRGIDEPAREAEAVRRRTRGHWRQHRWQARLHGVALLVVFAAHEQERVARRGQFLHHHRGGQARLQIIHRLFRGGGRGLGALHGVVEIRAVKFFQLGELPRIPLLGRDGENRLDRRGHAVGAVEFHQHGGQRGRGETEAPDVVIAQSLVPEPHGERGVGRHVHGIAGEQHGFARFLFRRAVDGPAGAAIRRGFGGGFCGSFAFRFAFALRRDGGFGRGEERGDAVTRLRIIRLGFFELDLDRLRQARRGDLGLDFAQHEIAVGVPPETFVRQTRVGKRLKQQAAELPRRQRRGELVNILRRIFPAREISAVLLARERRAAE